MGENRAGDGGARDPMLSEGWREKSVVALLKVPGRIRGGDIREGRVSLLRLLQQKYH